MVGRTPHPGPLPIGSADSADAEREKRSQRLDEIVRRIVHGFMVGWECKQIYYFSSWIQTIEAPKRPACRAFGALERAAAPPA